MGDEMFTVRCTECGAKQGDGVTVQKKDNKSREINPDTMISTDISTTFYCDHCEIMETVETGVLPEKNADHFTNCKDSASEEMVVRVDGNKLPYDSVDEQITENAYYTSEGVRGTSKVHHIHIHVSDPPTVSKGKHLVEVGDYLSETMVLGDVRYHDENNRTLKFFRSLDDGIMEPINDNTGEIDYSSATRS